MHRISHRAVKNVFKLEVDYCDHVCKEYIAIGSENHLSVK